MTPTPEPEHVPFCPLAPASPLDPAGPGSPGQPRRMESLSEPSRPTSLTSAERHRAPVRELVLGLRALQSWRQATRATGICHVATLAWALGCGQSHPSQMKGQPGSEFPASGGHWSGVEVMLGRALAL